jgi:hypothetical protein
LVGKSEGEGKFGRLRHRYESDIKINFEEMAFKNMDRIQLAEDSVNGVFLTIANT